MKLSERMRNHEYCLTFPSPQDWADEVAQLEAELGLYRQRLLDAKHQRDDGYKQLQQVTAERDALADGLHEIIQWCNAYPLSVFPEPDLKKAHELLKAGGITLDAVSASAMRHVLKGIIEIVEESIPKATRKEVSDEKDVIR